MTKDTDQDDILSTLTEEERKALEIDDNLADSSAVEEAQQTMEKMEEGQIDKIEKTGDAGELEENDEKEPEPGPETDVESTQGDNSSVEADDEEQQSNESSLDLSAIPDSTVSKLPDDFDERLNTLKNSRDDLAKQYNEGEIDFDDYNRQRNAIDDALRTLDHQKIKSDMAFESAVNTFKNSHVPNFLNENPIYKQNERLFNLLDQEVVRLQNAANADGKDYLSPAILQMAQENLKRDLPQLFGQEAKSESKTSKPTSKQPVPKTISGLPSEGVSTDDGGKFALLDRLADSDPLKYEEAMASMSDSERERYLNS